MPPVLRERSRTVLVVGALAGSLLACGGSGAPGRRPARPPAPPSGLGRPAVEWVRGAAPAERVLVGEAGIAIGPASRPPRFVPFRSQEPADDLRFFAASFAPFAAASPGERLVFAGHGQASPSAAERRMIEEWTRKTVAEMTVGEGSAYGLALAWRGGALACDGVSVFLSGEVRAGACDWRQDVRGRLAAEPLARLYRWFDGYGPFQVDALGATTRGAESATGVIFAGRGPLPAPPQERLAMGDFAAALHRDLAARRTAALSAGPPPPVPASVLLRPDLPSPAPAIAAAPTPITPLASPAPDRETAESPPVPAATETPATSAPPAPAGKDEEDEAPVETTEPRGDGPPTAAPPRSGPRR